MLTTLVLASLALAPKEDFPPIVKAKELYATNDFRGMPAPKIETESWLAGGEPEVKGKVVLVDIWATWCGPCRKLIPEMNEWAKEFKDEMVVIGISDEPAETVTKFMKETPMNYHVAVDTQKRVSKALGVKGIPHVLVLSPDGIVRWQGFPGSTEDPLTIDKVRQIIKASGLDND